MRTRRGASFYRSELARMLAQFYPGALVGPLTVSSPGDSIAGIVKSVNPAENKVYVAWNGGAVKQHDPDEIALRVFPVDLGAGTKSVDTMSEAASEPSADDAQVEAKKKLASRRGRFAVSWVKTKTKNKEGLPGWKDKDTGEVRYQKEQPGEEKAPKKEKPKVDVKKVKEQVKEQIGGKFDSKEGRKSTAKSAMKGMFEKHGISNPEFKASTTDISTVIRGKGKAADGSDVEIELEVNSGKKKKGVVGFAYIKKPDGSFAGSEEDIYKADLSKEGFDEVVKKVTADLDKHLRGKKSSVGRRMAMIKFMGDEDTHGIDEPVSGGTDVMRVLARKLSVEALEYSQNQKGRRMAVYHRMRGRIYRRTKFERENDTLVCPRCRPDLVEMEKQPFVRGMGIWVCPKCGWKITTDKVID